MQLLDNMYYAIYIMLQYIMYYMRGMLTMNGEIITQTQNNNDLLLKKDNQKELFNRFIVFIDASPNTIRTYRGSLRQWFKYLS